MLDWIFEGIIGWVSGIISSLMDAVSGLFLEALGTDMTAMEEYFPFVTKAYGVMQVMAYAMQGCCNRQGRLLLYLCLQTDLE